MRKKVSQVKMVDTIKSVLKVKYSVTKIASIISVVYEKLIHETTKNLIVIASFK